MPNTTHAANTRGSEWRRWDPHIHAPGTLAADGFDDRWEDYCHAIETKTPTVEALGITDYMCFETYRKVREYHDRGRMSNVKLIFPNIEMRLGVKPEKGAGVNIHLLFSPDDPEHEQQIERVLSRLTFKFQDSLYGCSIVDLKRLGRDFRADQKLPDAAALQIGAHQFKVSLDQLQEMFEKNAWVRANCLIAVAGSSNDGTAVLQKDASFAALRQEIESFANIIFSATPSQRDFWLGRHPAFPREAITRTYRSLKPCLHGCDAHSVARILAPEGDRFCWLKGDPTFETLRQAVIEPEQRAWIGPSPPSGAPQSYCVDSVVVRNATWLHDPNVQLNSGIVAIIGARGSGKTALADMIAVGGGYETDSMGISSFLHRASHPRPLLGNADTALCWADGSRSEARRLSSQPSSSQPETSPDVSYLSQHFVETLCSSSGLATQLRTEIERVIFDVTPQIERLGASSFAELAEFALAAIQDDRNQALDTLRAISARIASEETAREQLPVLKERQKKLRDDLIKWQAQLADLIPKGEEERSKKLAEAQLWVSRSETRVEALGKRIQTLKDLASRTSQIKMVREPERLAVMKIEFAAAALDETDWLTFRMDFVGDVESIVADKLAECDRLRTIAISGDAKEPTDAGVPRIDWPLEKLRQYRDRLKAEVGSDVQKQKRYSELEKAIREHQQSLTRTTASIEHLEGASERIRKASIERRLVNVSAFETIAREESILRRLYAPLATVLASSTASLRKMKFDVIRSVDIDDWSDTGERLLDLRLSSGVRGRGRVKELATTHLLNAWTSGAPEDVATAMESFITNFKDDLDRARPRNKGEERARWHQEIANWLFDVSHIQLSYTITYDGIAIEQLSPGTRGIVLLLLYLAIDTSDRRPLIIDQPEENLDPRSVFEELVPHFKEARKRRQIIIVTHNANLVVNTDVDQVIFASSEIVEDGLPTICYRAGSLESREIRDVVCMTLEGGEDAFRERERRYRLRWD